MTRTTTKQLLLTAAIALASFTTQAQTRDRKEDVRDKKKTFVTARKTAATAAKTSGIKPKTVATNAKMFGMPNTTVAAAINSKM
ncbi:hypothetical protein [Phnomibacter ginsenosidimutans]|uniref:Uncharacterized protein n=1 Tax=Phnomibacter ginsenosidimutans TaxID=2676868 RepID=A0A6I6GPA0_9BACT|nr:hypothetical protein [Phnomibacter ginsenosidimutans]QGW26909.1 hypothetical protein GLV81_01270 [Phnomibacter ginsenosidimutans]